MIWPIKNTTKCSFRKKFVYVIRGGITLKIKVWCFLNSCFLYADTTVFLRKWFARFDVIKFVTVVS